MYVIMHLSTAPETCHRTTLWNALLLSYIISWKVVSHGTEAWLCGYIL